MRIPTNKSNKKVFIIIAAVIILFLSATATAYYFKVGPFRAQVNDSINMDPATDEQKAAGSDIKQNTLEQVNDGKSSTGSDPSPAPQPIPGSDKSSVGMEISATNQTETTLQIRSFIQTITSTGSCNLSITNTQGGSYVANAGVQALSSTTTCKGFDAPINQLSPGVWTISISFTNDNLTASTSKEITIK